MIREPHESQAKTMTENLLVSLNDVEEKEASWLVPQRMPKGQIIILAGDGGSGKTSCWCSLAAAISTGAQVFFDETPKEFFESEPQKVLFFSSEDSLEYTLKARLRKAGANFNNIFSVDLKNERFSEIKFNSKLLKELIEQVKPALIVFDPLQAFIPVDMQMGQRNAMRACLSPLIGIGEQYGVTSLIVVHTNKKQGVFGRNRIADSADVWDIARSVMIVGSVPGSNERYLSQEKSNYGPLSQTVLFDIGENGAEFTGFSDKHDADYVGMRDYERRQAPQRADAEQFIIEYLNNGKKPTAELDESAEAAGISKNTLSRAKTGLRKKKILGSKAEGFGNSKVFYSYLLSTSH